MGAGIWLDTILCRLRHAAGDRAARLRGAAAMTRNHFSPIGYGTPMSNIVERLRRYHKDDEPPTLYDEAADEIERLTAELARIRGLPRLAALDAEIERLHDDVAKLQGRNLELAQENLRLKAFAQEIVDMDPSTEGDADYFQALARAALAGQPLAGKEPKP